MLLDSTLIFLTLAGLVHYQHLSQALDYCGFIIWTTLPLPFPLPHQSPLSNAPPHTVSTSSTPQQCPITKGPSIDYVIQKGRRVFFSLFKSIKILSQSTTWGRGLKNGSFWCYIIYGQPLKQSEQSLYTC